MTEIRKSGDCGNSPKNRLLQELVIAFARGDGSRVAEVVTEEVRWQPVGGKAVQGVETVCRAVTRHGPATRLTIAHVVSHGRAGAVDGVVEFGRKRRAFCHVFEFGSAKGDRVRGITSFSIALR